MAKGRRHNEEQARAQARPICHAKKLNYVCVCVWFVWRAWPVQLRLQLYCSCKLQNSPSLRLFPTRVPLRTVVGTEALGGLGPAKQQNIFYYNSKSTTKRHCHAHDTRNSLHYCANTRYY
jgi:hypothetical protein